MGKMGAAWLRRTFGEASDDNTVDNTAASDRSKLSDQIDSIVEASHVLRVEDFDDRVFEIIESINGSGGPAMVCAALLMVQDATSKKARVDVRNWPAYVATLLGKFVDGTTAPRQADVVQISKQLSWVLRRGARQSGVWISGGGWVRLQDLIGCKYFADYSEAQIIAIVNASNSFKVRYEMRISENGENEIRANSGEESAWSNRGGFNAGGTPSRQYREPGTPAASGHTLCTNGLSPSRYGGEFSPAVERTPQAHGTRNLADYTPDAKQSWAVARQLGPVLEGQPTKSRSSENRSREEAAVSESSRSATIRGVSAVLRLGVCSLIKSSMPGQTGLIQGSVSDDELERLARDSLLEIGFRKQHILSVEVDANRTSCLVQVLLADADAECMSSHSPSPLQTAPVCLPR